MSEALEFIRFKWQQPQASGRRTGWARTFSAIDRNVRGAKAWQGEYLRNGIETEMELGTLAIEVRPVGSVKNGWNQARFIRLERDGWQVVSDRKLDWRADYLSIVDDGLELLRGELN